jgi:hypothetical protein
MLGRHLACAVLKLPRRVSEDRPELLSASAGEKVDGGVAQRVIG